MAPSCSLPYYARHNAITVFYGFCLGNVYVEAADQLACTFARRGVELVYGGGTKGLMGRVSSRALDEGGKVHGIIPAAFLAQEVPDRAGTRPNEKETIVRSMHERKKMSKAGVPFDRSGVADLSYFIGLPGGYDTLEEVAEMTTWSHIGVHLKRESRLLSLRDAASLIFVRTAVVLLNINGFYSQQDTSRRHTAISCANFEHAASEGCAAYTLFAVFVDGPPTKDTSFDWGEAALRAIDEWEAEGAGGAVHYPFEWSKDAS